jgi:hypothetical protein
MRSAALDEMSRGLQEESLWDARNQAFYRARSCSAIRLNRFKHYPVLKGE